LVVVLLPPAVTVAPLIGSPVITSVMAPCRVPGEQATTVMRLAPVAVWPSGLMMVMLFVPAAALVVFRLTVAWVGSVNVTLLTVMPPVAVAPMWFA
jgi:hypothetical protein